MQQLVDFHPSTRQKIADILPTIKPSQPSAVVTSSKSKYFEEQVEWCRYFFSSDWKPGHTISQREPCDIVGVLLSDQSFQIRMKVVRFDSKTNNVREVEYCIDAAIAILQLGLLLLERTKRLARPNCRRVLYSCICCRTEDDENESSCDYRDACPVIACFRRLSMTFRLIGPITKGDPKGYKSEEDEDITKYWKDWRYWQSTPEKGGGEDLIRDWVIAVGYATPDGSPHALRSVISKYVDLPPMRPHLGPNDEPENIKPRWLYDAVRAVEGILLNMRIPERKMEAVPDVAGMSI